MLSQKIAEKSLNTTSVLNNFKSFTTLLHQKEWRQNISKKKNRNNYLSAVLSQMEEKLMTLKKYTRFAFNNWENLLFFKTPIFIKVNLSTHIYPTRNWELFLLLTQWSCSKCKDILHILNVYNFPSKEHQLVDSRAADEI